MHGNHGRSQRRGQGAKEDRQEKAKERLTAITDGQVFSSNAERRRHESLTRASFEKRAK